MIYHGDCLDVMATLPESSVDAIVCDPPYGLEFMGKEWDKLWGTPNDTFTRRPKGGVGPFARPRPTYGTDSRTMQEWHQRWATEALRVATPGAYLLAFGGTRTYHRLACAIEDAGWIIRDCLVWAYAQGFPKSRALLKPAWEPIVMARQPGPLRELAIDACRIGVGDPVPGGGNGQGHNGGRFGAHETAGTRPIVQPHDLGRWPANVILTDPIFDGGVDGVVGGGETAIAPPYRITAEHADRAAFPVSGNGPTYGDLGTYSRFFLIPKADRAEREPNEYSKQNAPLTARRETAHRRTGPMDTPFLRGETMRLNPHPTVKPLDLMRHLVRLVTPPSGTVLDPFLGSGTTAIAAEMEGFAWIGIEREAEYVAIAHARLQGVQRGLGLAS